MKDLKKFEIQIKRRIVFVHGDLNSKRRELQELTSQRGKIIELRQKYFTSIKLESTCLESEA
ncbi:hypothetical protein ACTXT7_013644 [Hymenolepis weldensis]